MVLVKTYFEFYSKNKGKSTYTVARKIRGFKWCFGQDSAVDVYSLVAFNIGTKKESCRKTTLYKVLGFS